MENKELTLEVFEKIIKEYYSKKEPDIKIYESEAIFYFDFCSKNGNIRSGIGGLQMIFNNTPDLDEMKIDYNGNVLNTEQKIKLFNKIKKYNGK